MLVGCKNLDTKIDFFCILQYYYYTEHTVCNAKTRRYKKMLPYFIIFITILLKMGPAQVRVGKPRVKSKNCSQGNGNETIFALQTVCGYRCVFSLTFHGNRLFFSLPVL